MSIKPCRTDVTKLRREDITKTSLQHLIFTSYLRRSDVSNFFARMLSVYVKMKWRGKVDHSRNTDVAEKRKDDFTSLRRYHIDNSCKYKVYVVLI